MGLIAAAPAGLSKQRICHALDQPRHRCYPDRPRRKVAPAPARAPARRLTAEQDKAILAALHSERFVDSSPRQVHAQLLSEGIVLASMSTSYRRLHVLGQTPAQRLPRPPQRHVRPHPTATAPQQVWTCDITKLPTFSRGVYLNLYLILDLFSRYPGVGKLLTRSGLNQTTRIGFRLLVARPRQRPGRVWLAYL